MIKYDKIQKECPDIWIDNSPSAPVDGTHDEDCECNDRCKVNVEIQGFYQEAILDPFASDPKKYSKLVYHGPDGLYDVTEESDGSRTHIKTHHYDPISGEYIPVEQWPNYPEAYDENNKYLKRRLRQETKHVSEYWLR